MVNPSFVISGVVRDLDINGISAMTVTLHNLTTGNELEDTSTAGGEYSKNCQAFTGALISGDIIEVINYDN